MALVSDVNLTNVVSFLQLAHMSTRAIKPVLITVFTIKLMLFTDLTINLMLISEGTHQTYFSIDQQTFAVYSIYTSGLYCLV